MLIERARGRLLLCMMHRNRSSIDTMRKRGEDSSFVLVSNQQSLQAV